MAVYKAAERLQEALDLLSDLEKRRKVVLEDVLHLGPRLGLEQSQVETLVDGAHDAATAHLFHCMMAFRQAYEDEHAPQSEGS